MFVLLILVLRWKIGWMMLAGKTEKTSVWVPLSPPKIQHGLRVDRPAASNCWATARPGSYQQHPTPILSYQQHLTPVLSYQQHPTVLSHQQHPTPILSYQQHLTPVLSYQQHPTPILSYQQHLTPVLSYQQHPTPVLRIYYIIINKDRSMQYFSIVL